MICKEALDLIKHFESLHDGDLTAIGLQPKMCPAGIWTVGYGRALTNHKGEFLKGESKKAIAYAMYPSMTVELAEQFLLEDVAKFSLSVDKVLMKEPNEFQFGAMVSLAYNIGIMNFSKSSVLRYFNEADLARAADSFLLWKKAGGKILAGLVRRREAERELFLTQNGR